jgi:hypothetical protein
MLKLAAAAPDASVKISLKCKGFFSVVPAFDATANLIFKNLSYSNINPFATLVNG